jgi:hypothetical protein
MTEDTYKILSIVGSWLAGIGSLAAVITSLWLARKESRIKLAVTVKHMKVLTQGGKERPDYVNIKVVNLNIRPAKITNIGWEVGRFKNKVHFLQLFGDSNSDQIPKVLNEGEEGNFMVPFRLRNTDDDWIKRFPKDLLLPNPKRKIKTLKTIVYTSVNKKFKVKPDKNLISTLLKEAEAN